MNPEDRQRALRGSVEERYLLKLPSELAARVKAAAEREGLSRAEWWRRAGEAWLERSRKLVEGWLSPAEVAAAVKDEKQMLATVMAGYDVNYAGAGKQQSRKPKKVRKGSKR